MLGTIRKRVLTSFVLSCLIMMLNGCVYLVVGSVGVLGGYVISPDTVEGHFAGQGQDAVWEAAIDVVSAEGVIEERNDAGGILIAKVRGTKLTITVLKVSGTDVKLIVKARKAFLPKIKVAQDIYIKIQESLYE